MWDYIIKSIVAYFEEEQKMIHDPMYPKAGPSAPLPKYIARTKAALDNLVQGAVEIGKDARAFTNNQTEAFTGDWSHLLVGKLDNITKAYNVVPGPATRPTEDWE